MKTNRNRLLAATGLATALLMSPELALAQTAPAQPAAQAGEPDDASTVDEIVVTGIRASLRNSLAGKQAAPNVVEVL